MRGWPPRGMLADGANSSARDSSISARGFRQAVELGGAVDDALRHQMDDAFRAPLHPALDQHQPRAHHLAAEALEGARPQHDVGDAGLVLQRDEDRLAVARPLAHQHHAGGAHPARRPARADVSAQVRTPSRVKTGAQDRHRMRLSATAAASGNRPRHARPAAWRAGRHRAPRPARAPRRRRTAAADRRPAGAARPTAPRAGRAPASGRHRHRPAARSVATARRAALAQAPRRWHSRRRAADEPLRLVLLHPVDLAEAQPQRRARHPSRRSSVLSQSLSFTSTARTSTPCSCASRTICAGA